ncbi:LOW QUALITY PROTEIN: L-isoD(D-D) O-methyltransferase [Geomicrobium sp. JCM 19055]|nr:LOW QUALITY PROTEIN: L-isoD(D-D) O-methyltransferase [Geomicrobium sp. JCM 19055]
MLITTSRKPTLPMLQKAKRLSHEWNVPHLAREKRTIASMHHTDTAVYMVGKNGKDVLYNKGHDDFFFHPSMATIRIQRLEKGGHDPFATITTLQHGDSFLDLTLGLASDSIVASYLVGKDGIVHGVEKQQTVAEIVKSGLSTWDDGSESLLDAMRRIQVIQRDHTEYLRTLADQSFDVVYLDPMFERTIDESLSLNGLRASASYDTLQSKTLDEARRVARKHVILKAESSSSLWEKYSFERLEKRPSRTSYGALRRL